MIGKQVVDTVAVAVAAALVDVVLRRCAQLPVVLDVLRVEIVHLLVQLDDVAQLANVARMVAVAVPAVGRPVDGTVAVIAFVAAIVYRFATVAVTATTRATAEYAAATTAGDTATDAGTLPLVVHTEDVVVGGVLLLLLLLMLCATVGAAAARTGYAAAPLELARRCSVAVDAGPIVQHGAAAVRRVGVAAGGVA